MPVLEQAHERVGVTLSPVPLMPAVVADAVALAGWQPIQRVIFEGRVRAPWSTMSHDTWPQPGGDVSFRDGVFRISYDDKVFFCNHPGTWW
jgi:hypothetical protein